MAKHFTVVIFLFSILSQPVCADNDVRVRLESKKTSFEISGEQIKIQGQENFINPVSIPQTKKVKITRMPLKSFWVWKVTKTDNNLEKTELIADKFLVIQGLHLKEKGRSLPGKLVFNATKENFDVIASMKLENYLAGVLASEMPLSWPLQSLKAQAVAARSYALAVMKDRKAKPYHLESTILDQVFNHVSEGPDGHPLIEKALQAVNETKGMIIVDSKEKVLKAFYHADCGGKTSSAKSVWGVGETKGSVVDEYCPGNPKATWQLEVKKENLISILKRKIPELVGDVATLGLQFIRPTQNDRVEKIEIISAGHQKILSAAEFRSMLGFSDLKSTKFQMSQNEKAFVFSGVGFGHGVGLCQWGSRAMAKNGKNFDEILRHYYPSGRLHVLEVQKNSTRE